ncbi:uncharacterized protein L199_000794 [Kwoniella botswanensis]|uniref:uncharacterized protein n=1 Tax=Kwoniella botswanensis TaxID=1268659 RepID=UPI00315D4845
MGSHNGQNHYPQLHFELSAMEAHSLEALPATTFAFGREMHNEDQAYGVQLRDFLIDRGYRTSPVPYKFRKQVKHDKFGVFIHSMNNQAERKQLPKGWKAFSFTKAVEYVRKAEFQAAILHWQGLDNDGKLPYDQRKFVAMTTGERGMEMAIRAFGQDSRMVQNHFNNMGDHMTDASHEDIYMLSPDISSINRPENRILAYAIDRNKPDTDDDEEEEEWGGISPLNVGSPASKVEEEEVNEDSQAGEEEGDVHVEEHHQERPGVVKGEDLVYIEEQVEFFAEDDESEDDTDQSTHEGGSWADDEVDSEEDEDDWKFEDRTSQDDGPGAGHGIEEKQDEAEEEDPVEVDREEDEEEEDYYNGEEYYIDGEEDDNGEEKLYLNDQEDDWYREEQYMDDQGINNQGLLQVEEAILGWNEGVEVQHVHPGIPHARKRSPSPTDIKNKRDRSPVRKRMRIRSPSP